MKRNGRRISRRAMLKAGGVAVAGLAPSALVAARPRSQHASAPNSPRNIVFMVADGMSPGVPALAEAFSQLLGRGETRWSALARDERTVHGLLDMHSLDSLVTDSAAASSAWGSGARVRNWSLNTLPDGRRVAPIAALVRAQGRSIGLVTTTRITHATPAGFAVNCPDRNQEDAIALQYMDRVELLLGGGRRHFDAGQRRDRRDVGGEFTQAGWTIIESRDALLQLPENYPLPLLGLFDDDHLPYTLDQAQQPADAQTVPALDEMVRCALNRLVRSDRGFLLQIEGGRIDHAAHDNDSAAMLHEQLAFDRAIGLATEFAAERGDTLVVITTDHGTGNPGLSGMGSKYRASDIAFARLAAGTQSFHRMHEHVTEWSKANARTIEPAALTEIIHTATGIEIQPHEARAIVAAYASEPTGEICKLQGNAAALLGQALSNVTGVTFTGITHTSDWCPLLAIGPGAELFRGLQAGTSIFGHLTSLFGIRRGNGG